MVMAKDLTRQQTRSYLDVFEFFHKKITSQFRPNLCEPQYCSLTAMGSKQTAKSTATNPTYHDISPEWECSGNPGPRYLPV